MVLKFCVYGACMSLLLNVMYGRRNKKCEGGRIIFLEGWVVVVCIVFNYQQDKSLLDEDNTDEDTEYTYNFLLHGQQRTKLY